MNDPMFLFIDLHFFLLSFIYFFFIYYENSICQLAGYSFTLHTPGCDGAIWRERLQNLSMLSQTMLFYDLDQPLGCIGFIFPLLYFTYK